MGVIIEPYGFTTNLELENARWREIREKPFDIYGLYQPHSDGQFRRLPADVAEATSRAVTGLAKATAGARIRFCTDSDFIALHAEMLTMNHMDLMARTGSAGFDLYVKEGARYYFYGIFRPGAGSEDFKGLEQVVRFPDRRPRQILIHFPLYSQVDKVYIGVGEDAMLDHGERYRFDKPVVYYGSSITMGGCVSRPGNTYEAIIGMEYDCDYVNLGFAGAAKGEDAIRDYIASMDMSVFVMDYDHNAPTTEHLIETYEPFYRAVRAAHPDMPIIMVTAPDTHQYIHGATGRDARRAVIYGVYEKALAEGDRNVRFIDGDSLFEGKHHDICTVDGCHPTDAGAIRMAERIGHVLGSVLN